MLTFEPNIIVIDDKKDEVQGVIDWYNSRGIGCYYFNADLSDGDEMPNNSYSDVNLIFLDLYFSSEKVDHELCANWIQSIIPEKSFYVLVIWTKDPAEATEVLEELFKINRSPFVNLVKNKSEYPNSSKYKYDFTELLRQIDNELEEIPSLAEIGVWKKSTKRASNIVIGGLSKNSTPDLFIAKLQKIIVSHGGTSMYEVTETKQKRSVLFNALDQVLVSNTKNSIPNDDIHKINEERLYSLPDNIFSEIDKELNSWFHFTIEKEIPSGMILPGLICEFNDGKWKDMYSLENDKTITNLLGKQDGDSTNIKSVVLLLSRACDIAQGKFGNNLKLLSGLKIVNPVRKENAKQNFIFKNTKPDSVKLYDHLFMSDDDNDVALLFDFRYVFSVPVSEFFDEFKNIKVFNKELLSEMQVEYSNYSSRLGTTQII